MVHFEEHGIPMLIYGPGDPGIMHEPGESVAVSAIQNTVVNVDKVLAAFAER